jgi:hypothetical protein
MSNTANSAPESALDVSLDEQWALHSATLEYVERTLGDEAYPDPAAELAILEKLEGGQHRFTQFEFGRLQDILAEYAAREDTPDVDRAPANAVVERIEAHCPTDGRH